MLKLTDCFKDESSYVPIYRNNEVLNTELVVVIGMDNRLCVVLIREDDAVIFKSLPILGDTIKYDFDVSLIGTEEFTRSTVYKIKNEYTDGIGSILNQLLTTYSITNEEIDFLAKVYFNGIDKKYETVLYGDLIANYYYRKNGTRVIVNGDNDVALALRLENDSIYAHCTGRDNSDLVNTDNVHHQLFSKVLNKESLTPRECFYLESLITDYSSGDIPKRLNDKATKSLNLVSDIGRFSSNSFISRRETSSDGAVSTLRILPNVLPSVDGYRVLHFSNTKLPKSIFIIPIYRTIHGGIVGAAIFGGIHTEVTLLETLSFKTLTPMSEAIKALLKGSIGLISMDAFSSLCSYCTTLNAEHHDKFIPLNLVCTEYGLLFSYDTADEATDKFNVLKNTLEYGSVSLFIGKINPVDKYLENTIFESHINETGRLCVGCQNIAHVINLWLNKNQDTYKLDPTTDMLDLLLENSIVRKSIEVCRAVCKLIENTDNARAQNLINSDGDGMNTEPNNNHLKSMRRATLNFSDGEYYNLTFTVKCVSDLPGTIVNLDKSLGEQFLDMGLSPHTYQVHVSSSKGCAKHVAYFDSFEEAVAFVVNGIDYLELELNNEVE